MPPSTPASSTIELPAPAIAFRGRSPLEAAWHRLLANRIARGGLVIIVVFTLMAVLSPVFLPYNPQVDADLLARLKPPS
ncbi:MAG TPA: ABC transporter permease, partial [Candidatus Methylomirabilis sp.]